MTDSADRFEAWINNMSEEEFQDRIDSDREDGGFSPAQEEKALNIREPVEDTEAEALMREQESGVREIQTSKPIYDTRDLPQKRTFFQVVKDRLVPVRTEKVRQAGLDIARQPAPQQARPIQRPTVRQRLESAGRRFLSILGRGRPTPPTGEA